MRAWALVLLISPGLAGAQPTGSNERLGGSAKRLLAGALAFLPTVGYPDACFTGAKAVANIYTDPRVAGQGRAGYLNNWTFFFSSPPPKPGIVPITVTEPSGEPPLDPFNPNRTYNEYEHKPNSDRWEDTECITDLVVDSGRAYAAALKHGLAINPNDTYLLHLLRASNASSPYWKDKRLRRRTFWIVETDQGDEPNSRYVDALTGVVIKAGPRVPGSSLRFKSSGPAAR